MNISDLYLPCLLRSALFAKKRHCHSNILHTIKILKTGTPEIVKTLTLKCKSLVFTML